MKLSSHRQVQKLPIPIEVAWDFFSSPLNLKDITPKELDFNVLSSLPEKMYPGLLIEYTVKPVLSIPVYWVTEITQVSEPNFFIDEQRFGPYAFWHHRHFFKKIEGGVEMTDIIKYKLPFGPLGKIADSLFVGAQLEKIFSHRYKVLEEKFGKL